MSYKFLEHTADLKFLVEGKTLEESFSESALALKQAIAENIKVKEKMKKQIKVNGKDYESLLYNFLEEFLYLLDAEDFLLSKIKNIKIDKIKEKTKSRLELTAEITGDKASNYKFTNDVKAITYNDMFVKFDKKQNKWSCQVVLDV